MIQFPLDELARSKERMLSADEANAERDVADHGERPAAPKSPWYRRLFSKRRSDR